MSEIIQVIFQRMTNALSYYTNNNSGLNSWNPLFCCRRYLFECDLRSVRLKRAQERNICCKSSVRRASRIIDSGTEACSTCLLIRNTSLACASFRFATVRSPFDVNRILKNVNAMRERTASSDFIFSSRRFPRSALHRVPNRSSLLAEEQIEVC